MSSTLKFGLILFIASLVGCVTAAPLPAKLDSPISALASGNVLPSTVLPKTTVKSSTGDHNPVVVEVEDYVDEALKKSEEKSEEAVTQKIDDLRQGFTEQIENIRSNPEMGDAPTASEEPMEKVVAEPEAGEVGGSVLEAPSSEVEKIDGIDAVKEEEEDDEVLSELKDDELDDDLSALEEEGLNSDVSPAPSADDDLDDFEDDSSNSDKSVAPNADSELDALDDQVLKSTGSDARDEDEDLDADASDDERLNGDGSLAPKDVGANSLADMSDEELEGFAAYKDYVADHDAEEKKRLLSQDM